MAVVSMKQLLEAGVHFGHQTRRWNPKMASYIYTERNGIYIIDLQKTVKKLEEAYSFVRELAANGQSILFVGTKKQAQDAIKEEAERVGQYYVNARWLGGMLTNFRTMRTRIDRLAQLQTAILQIPRQIFAAHVPSSPPHGCSPAVCGIPGIRPRAASPRSLSGKPPHAPLFWWAGTHTAQWPVSRSRWCGRRRSSTSIFSCSVSHPG